MTSVVNFFDIVVFPEYYIMYIFNSKSIMIEIRIVMNVKIANDNIVKLSHQEMITILKSHLSKSNGV